MAGGTVSLVGLLVLKGIFAAPAFGASREKLGRDLAETCRFYEEHREEHAARVVEMASLLSLPLSSPASTPHSVSASPSAPPDRLPGLGGSKGKRETMLASAKQVEKVEQQR